MTNTKMSEPDDVRTNETDKLLASLIPNQEKRGPGRPRKVETLQEEKAVKVSDSKQQVWVAGLAAAMHTLDVKSPKDIHRCAEIADVCLEEFNKRWA